MLALSCHSQKSIADTVSTDIQYLITGDFRSIHKDQLDYLYLVTDNNEIIKLDKDYSILFRFSITRLGNISSIDVSNPQKILVYYPEYYNIVFLDNTLSEIKRLDLESLDYKIDERGQLFNSSSELYNEGIDVYSELSILTHEEQVFLYNKESIWVFDNFGQYHKRLDIKTDKLQLINNELIYAQGHSILRYKLDVEFADPIKEVYKSETPFLEFVLSPSIPSLILIDKKGAYIKNL